MHCWFEPENDSWQMDNNQVRELIVHFDNIRTTQISCLIFWFLISVFVCVGEMQRKYLRSEVSKLSHSLTYLKQH